MNAKLPHPRLKELNESIRSIAGLLTSSVYGHKQEQSLYQDITKAIAQDKDFSAALQKLKKLGCIAKLSLVLKLMEFEVGFIDILQESKPENGSATPFSRSPSPEDPDAPGYYADKIPGEKWKSGADWSGWRLELQAPYDYLAKNLYQKTSVSVPALPQERTLSVAISFLGNVLPRLNDADTLTSCLTISGIKDCGSLNEKDRALLHDYASGLRLRAIFARPEPYFMSPEELAEKLTSADIIETFSGLASLHLTSHPGRIYFLDLIPEIIAEIKDHFGENTSTLIPRMYEALKLVKEKSDILQKIERPSAGVSQANDTPYTAKPEKGRETN